MKKLSTLVVIIISALTVGCAAQKQAPMDVSKSFWTNSDKKVGIAMSVVPDADVHLPGAACLLCIAVAEVANSSISKQVKDFSTDSLIELPKEISKTMENNNISTVVIDKPVDVLKLPKYRSKLPNAAKRDFTSYKTKYDLTHLLVVDIRLLGVSRSYANYIPTSDPKGAFEGASYIVDLSDNTYTWYKPIEIHKAVTDGWDEPPTFPSLTNAYYQAIELGKASIVETFSVKPVPTKPVSEKRVDRTTIKSADKS